MRRELINDTEPFKQVSLNLPASNEHRCQQPPTHPPVSPALCHACVSCSEKWQQRFCSFRDESFGVIPRPTESDLRDPIIVVREQGRRVSEKARTESPLHMLGMKQQASRVHMIVQMIKILPVHDVVNTTSKSHQTWRRRTRTSEVVGSRMSMPPPAGLRGRWEGTNWKQNKVLRPFYT